MPAFLCWGRLGGPVIVGETCIFPCTTSRLCVEGPEAKQAQSMWQGLLSCDERAFLMMLGETGTGKDGSFFAEERRRVMPGGHARHSLRKPRSVFLVLFVALGNNGQPGAPQGELHRSWFSATSAMSSSAERVPLLFFAFPPSGGQKATKTTYVLAAFPQEKAI